jgi:glycosyltransferase involved in cell wall biosynthesis
LKNRKRTKIVLVANSTWNIYNFRLNLIKKLEASNCEIVVVAPIDEYIHYLYEAVNIKHIPLKNLSRKSTNPFKDILLLLELFRIYRNEKPDIVIHYTIKPNIFGNFAAYLNKIISICVVTGLGYTFLNEGWAKKVSTFLYRYSFSLSDKVVFENADDKDLFVKEKLAKEDICIALKGCGVDTSYFQPQNNKLKKKPKIIFLFIGRLLYDKGIVEFVEAAKTFNQKRDDAEFWVVGELDAGNPSAINKSQLLDWVDKKYILYHGTTTDIRSFIKKSDVIVLPSYREGLPKVILEGMAMGKPIITTLTAGCQQTVDEGRNGYLIPIKDHLALTEAMEKLADFDEDDLKVMGILSRKKVVQEFDDKIITREYIKLLNQLLASEKQIVTKKRLKEQPLSIL